MWWYRTDGPTWNHILWLFDRLNEALDTLKKEERDPTPQAVRNLLNESGIPVEVVPDDNGYYVVRLR